MVYIKSLFQFSVILIILASFTGCAPLYLTTSHNTPMFTGKKEFQASAGMSSGLNAQVAYAFTDHFGVSANYLYVRDLEETNGRTQKVGELGLGYYTNFDTTWCAEIFTGFGLGKGYAYDSSYSTLFSYDPYKANGNYYKLYIQPSIGMNKGKIIWNFSLKATYLHFTSIDIIYDGETVATGKTSKIFLEPVIKWHIPLLRRKLFAFIQAGYNFPIGKKPRFDHEPFIGSIGLLLRLTKNH